MTTEFKLVALKDIIPDPNQPRQYYDLASMDELTESVKSDGVLSPILLRLITNKRYEVIVNGEIVKVYKRRQNAKLFIIKLYNKHAECNN